MTVEGRGRIFDTKGCVRPVYIFVNLRALRVRIPGRQPGCRSVGLDRHGAARLAMTLLSAGRVHLDVNFVGDCHDPVHAAQDEEALMSGRWRRSRCRHAWRRARSPSSRAAAAARPELALSRLAARVGWREASRPSDRFAESNLAALGRYRYIGEYESQRCSGPGLLRRCAPRNDGEGKWILG